MNPVEVDLVRRKLGVLHEEMKLIQKIQKEHARSLSEPLVQHALLHALQIAIAAILDIAHHICSEEGNYGPDNYADAIEHLGKIQILPTDFTAQFSRVAKLRNLMVHAYENINYEYLWSLLPKFLEDSKLFSQKVEKRLR